MGVGGQRHAAAALSLGKITSTHRKRCSVGPTDALDGYGEKKTLCPHRGSNHDLYVYL